MKKLIADWNSLPAWLRTLIVLVLSAASGVIRHMYVTDHGCLTEHCILEYLYAGLHVGGVAVVAYFLKSPLGRRLEEEAEDGPDLATQYGIAQLPPDVAAKYGIVQPPGQTQVPK